MVGVGCVHAQTHTHTHAHTHTHTLLPCLRVLHGVTDDKADWASTRACVSLLGTNCSPESYP